MKVKEIIEQEKGKYTTYEVYQYTSKRKSIHTDYIKNIENDYDFKDYSKMNAIDYHIMNQEEYNRTVCVNCDSVDFEEVFDDKNAKVLVIVVEGILC